MRSSATVIINILAFSCPASVPDSWLSSMVDFFMWSPTLILRLRSLIDWYTYKLQTYTVLQGRTRPGWYRSSSSTETTAKHQISRRQHLSHYQHARTHICFHFSIGPLPIGTNCHVNSAWNHQSALSVSLCTVHQLFNRHSQPWHSSGKGLMPIAGYLPKNRRRTEESVSYIYIR